MNIFSKRSATLHFPVGILLRPVSGVLFILFLCCVTDVQAQRLAIRTNVPEWGLSSPNLGLEFALNNRLSLECTGALCPFRLKDDLYFKHARAQTELKYWFENILSHHYVGLMGFYSSFDLGFRKKGFYGDSYAVGLTYGYDWVLSRRWNLEFSAGLGAIHYRMVRYTPSTIHGLPDESGWKAAPVKLAISFVYIIK